MSLWLVNCSAMSLIMSQYFDTFFLLIIFLNCSLVQSLSDIEVDPFSSLFPETMQIIIFAIPGWGSSPTVTYRVFVPLNKQKFKHGSNLHGNCLVFSRKCHTFLSCTCWSCFFPCSFRGNSSWTFRSAYTAAHSSVRLVLIFAQLSSPLSSCGSSQHGSCWPSCWSGYTSLSYTPAGSYFLYSPSSIFSSRLWFCCTYCSRCSALDVGSQSSLGLILVPCPCGLNLQSPRALQQPKRSEIESLSYSWWLRVWNIDSPLDNSWMEECYLVAEMQDNERNDVRFSRRENIGLLSTNKTLSHDTAQYAFSRLGTNVQAMFVVTIRWTGRLRSIGAPEISSSPAPRVNTSSK